MIAEKIHYKILKWVCLVLLGFLVGSLIVNTHMSTFGFIIVIMLCLVGMLVLIWGGKVKEKATEFEKSNVFKPVWDQTSSIICILFCIVLIIFFEFYFGRLVSPFIWLFGGTLVVALFFIGLNIILRRWLYLPMKEFSYRLFSWSLILRLITMVFLYFVFKYCTGTPFQTGEGFDDHIYHRLGTQIADGWKQGDFYVLEYISWAMGLGHSGYPAFCGALYYLFTPSTILARIANCFIGSFVVLLAYKIGRDIWGERIGRTGGILAMLFPPMLFFSAIQVRDTILTFLVLFITYNFINLYSNRRIKFWQIPFIVGAIFSLFTFRVGVAVIILLSLLVYIIFFGLKLENVSVIKVAAGTFIILASLLALTKIENLGYFSDNIISSYNLREYYRNQWAMAESKISSYVSTPLFLAIVFPAPFPVLVDIPLDTASGPIRSDVYNIGGSLVWNILSFFALIGILSTLKDRLRMCIPLWFFTLSYLFALAQGESFTDIRIRLVVVPFLIIFTAVGLHRKNRNRIGLWLIYLLVIAILIFGYNYVRLAGRGMI